LESIRFFFSTNNTLENSDSKPNLLTLKLPNFRFEFHDKNSANLG